MGCLMCCAVHLVSGMLAVVVKLSSRCAQWPMASDARMLLARLWLQAVARAAAQKLPRQLASDDPRLQ